MLSNILADAAATLFVFLRTGQWRYLRLSALSRPAAARMLRYSAPLVPSTLCSWIINISDRYLIALLAGSAATGIYTVANKLPNILLTVASIFSSAWQLSALAQQPREEKERFFSNVCSVYTAVAFHRGLRRHPDRPVVHPAAGRAGVLRGVAVCAHASPWPRPSPA